MVLDDYRNAAHVKRLDHPRTSYFVPAWADAVPALADHAIVRNAFRKVLVDLDVYVLVFPML